MSAEQQQSQPDDGGVQRRGSVEIDGSTIQNGSATNGSVKKGKGKSPRKMQNPGILSMGGYGGGGKMNRSALMLSGMPKGTIGGIKGMTADELGASPKRKARHRRVGTDLNNEQSNADFLAEINKDLTPQEQLQMKKKSKEMQNERELQHALVKLAELEEHRTTAVEIIGNLENENEDLKGEADRLRSELQNALTEIHILEKSYKAMQESYTQDKRDYEENAKEQEMKLRELEQDITNKELALHEAEEQQKQNEQLMRLASLNSDMADGSTVAMGIETEKEKKLYEKYHNEKRKVQEKDQTIEQLLLKLQGQSRLEAENHQLINELDRTKEEAQEALMNQALSQKAMESELIALASRNSHLQKEKEELQRLLEASEMETQQMRMHVDRQRTMTRGGGIPGGLALQRDASANAQDMGDGNDLAAQMGGDYIGYDDEQDYEDDYYDDEVDPNQQVEAKEDTKVVVKKEKEVPDVVKEYLHLTASAVKIKYPKVTTIDSEDLIKKVSQFSFWEYHDHMVRIMKKEEKKLEMQQKQDEQKKQLERVKQNQAQSAARKESQGIIGKFRSFFGGGTGGTHGHTQQQHRTQAQSMMQKNRNGGLATSSRPKANSSATAKQSNKKASSAAAGGSKSVKVKPMDSSKGSLNAKNDKNGADNSSSNGKTSKSSSNDSKGKNKENNSNNNSNGSAGHKDSLNDGNGKKRKSTKGKSPAPMENIEKGFTKVANKMGFHNSPHHPTEQDMALLSQQSFKAIDPPLESGDEANDSNALI